MSDMVAMIEEWEAAQFAEADDGAIRNRKQKR
jgi:hypothetical protein